MSLQNYLLLLNIKHITENWEHCKNMCDVYVDFSYKLIVNIIIDSAKESWCFCEFKFNEFALNGECVFP